MPREHHANTTFQSVIGNSIFAVRGWFLKSKKDPFYRTHSRNALDLPPLFAVFTGVGFSQTLAFPKLIQIPELAFEAT